MATGKVVVRGEEKGKEANEIIVIRSSTMKYSRVFLSFQKYEMDVQKVSSFAPKSNFF